MKEDKVIKAIAFFDTRDFDEILDTSVAATVSFAAGRGFRTVGTLRCRA